MPATTAVSGRRPRERRTQEQRSAATRALISDATIRCLITEGYSNTTLSAVTEAAGLSRGAITHHFGSKSQMLVAAVADLADRSEAEMRAVSSELPDTSDRPRVVLSMLWDIFRSDLFFAMLELWSAARTDEALHEVVRESERELGRRHRELFADMFGPEIAGHQNFSVALDMTFNMMRGMALTSILRDNPRREEHLIAEWTRLFEQLIASGA